MAGADTRNSENGQGLSAARRDDESGCSVYIHLPFCRARCPYCGFYSTCAGSAAQDEYVGALLREAEMRLAVPSAAPTIYIGGGTPTALEPEQLERVLAAGVGMAAAGAEFTVEANPGTVTAQTADLLARYGVTRVSCGVQSFDDRILAGLGRIHTAATAEKTVRLLQERGIPAISIDLMFAVPGQGIAGWEASLRRAVSLAPAHISLYGLSVEPGTAFAARAAAGTLLLPGDDTYAAMYSLACEFLPANGFSQYELSNFARRGCECRHNTVYWERKPYAGLGASAHSYRPYRRWWNTADTAGYAATLQKGSLPVEGGETLDPAARRHEAVFLGLRMMRGLDLDSFEGEFGRDEAAALRTAAVPLLEQGLLERAGIRLRLGKAGLAVADAVTAALL